MIEKRIKDEMTICKILFSLMFQRLIRNAIYLVLKLKSKYGENKKNLNLIFIELGRILSQLYSGFRQEREI